jgi:hypothetical protein
MPMPWLEAPTALLPIWMFRENGQPYEGDPRHALNAVVERYKARGLTPVCAMELEFFLIDDSGKTMQVPPRPGRASAARRPRRCRSARWTPSTPSSPTFTTPARRWTFPPTPPPRKPGLGQFEVNLMHCDDALRAADDAWLFKMLVKGLARRHGFAASFMAKPYAEYSGSGLHTHFSVLDEKGDNIFDSGGPKGTAQLRHAVAGCLRRCMIRRCSLRRIQQLRTPGAPTSMRPPRFPGAMRTAPPRSAFPPATRRRGGSNIAWPGGREPLPDAGRDPGRRPDRHRGRDGAAARRHRQRLCDGPAADPRHLGRSDRGVREFGHPAALPAQGTDPQPGADQAAGTALHRRAERPKNGWSFTSIPSDHFSFVCRPSSPRFRARRRRSRTTSTP